MLMANGTLTALLAGRRSVRVRKDHIDHVLRPIERRVEGPDARAIHGLVLEAVTYISTCP
jgi:hypothetical protein